MSIHANINIGLSNHCEKHISPVDTIQILMRNGWSISHNNYICYLPVGDNDEADWQADENMSIEQLANILQTKELRKEIIGVMLTWQTTLIGCDLIFYPDKQYSNFSINLDANRPLISLVNNYQITNFLWYLEKFLPPLNNAFGVDFFSCKEYR